jgi:hypothetical protein
MKRIRVLGPRLALAWFGALAVLLAACAGTAQAQTLPVPPEGRKPVDKAPRPPEIDKPVQVLAPKVIPNPEAAANPAPPAAGARKFNPLYEVTSVFIIFMFTAGGVTALAVAARIFFRLTTSTDLRVVAWHDPWVRAHVARLEGAPADAAPPDAAPPDAAPPDAIS